MFSAGAATLEARDCEEFLIETAYGLNNMPAFERRIAYLFDCENVEEADYYSDAFESNEVYSGAFGIWAASEMDGPGGYGFADVQIEIDFSIAQDGDYYSIDESQPANMVAIETQDPGGNSNTFLGQPCDRWDLVYTEILSESFAAAFNVNGLGAGALGGAVFCAFNPLTTWGLFACAGAGAGVALLSTFHWHYWSKLGGYVLDCIFGWDVGVPLVSDHRPIARSAPPMRRLVFRSSPGEGRVGSLSKE